MQAVGDREAVTDHDVAAFVDVVQAAIGMPAGSWIHYGLTSSDVVDTAWCWMMRDACDLLVSTSSELLRTVVELARTHRDTVMIGRTHGIHAEPTTFGAKAALWALQIERHLQRTEVREVQEGFKTGQKGSSAMPHKRNPIAAETITGLSRVLRGNLQAGMQNVALWHERDISHSSVERIVLPDSAMLAFYVMRRMNRLLQGLDVFADRMVANLHAGNGVVFSQPVLLALVRSGMSRDDAYRIVQDNAAAAIEKNQPLRDLLQADKRMSSVSPAVLDEAFDIARSVRHATRGIEALDALDLD